jgi:2-methylcitrate dehydratase PrpD
VLLGLGRREMEDAIGIVTSTQAAGLRSVTGTSTKSLLAGTGGQRGMISALMARSGFGGPARSIEHPFGLAAAVSDHTTGWVTLPDMGERYGIERTVFKYYSACHALHSSIESVESLKDDGRPFAPDEITSVRIALAPRVMEIANVPEPTTTLQARFSARHIVSAYLTGLPKNASPLGPEGLSSPELATLRRRVEVVADDALGADAFTGLDLVSHLEVVTADGAVRKASVPARGVAAPDELADQWQRLGRKAAEFAPASLGDDWAGAVIEAVGALDRADGVDAVTALLR